MLIKLRMCILKSHACFESESNLKFAALKGINSRESDQVEPISVSRKRRKAIDSHLEMFVMTFLRGKLSFSVFLRVFDNDFVIAKKHMLNEFI